MKSVRHSQKLWQQLREWTFKIFTTELSCDSCHKHFCLLYLRRKIRLQLIFSMKWALYVSWPKSILLCLLVIHIKLLEAQFCLGVKKLAHAKYQSLVCEKPKSLLSVVSYCCQCLAPKNLPSLKTMKGGITAHVKNTFICSLQEVIG